MGIDTKISDHGGLYPMFVILVLYGISQLIQSKVSFTFNNEGENTGSLNSINFKWTEMPCDSLFIIYFSNTYVTQIFRLVKSNETNERTEVDKNDKLYKFECTR